MYSYLLNLFGESPAFAGDANSPRYLNVPGSPIINACRIISQHADCQPGGEITKQAAYLALAIYAEHTEDAHKNPVSYPYHPHSRGGFQLKR